MTCCLRTVCILAVLVAYATVSDARPKSLTHHVKPRKFAESSLPYKKDIYSKIPVKDDKGNADDQKHPVLHHVKLSKDNVSYNPKDVAAKYNSNSHDITSKRGPLPTNTDFVTVRDSKATHDEHLWPKLDDTDRLPDHITKPAHQKFIHWKHREKCGDDYDCPPGRMCEGGWCECMTPELCYHHHQPVCGSDAIFYPSHCELHRTACVERRHIRINHQGACFQRLPGSGKVGFVKEGQEENNDDISLDTKPDEKTGHGMMYVGDKKEIDKLTKEKSQKNDQKDKKTSKQLYDSDESDIAGEVAPYDLPEDSSDEEGEGEKKVEPETHDTVVNKQLKKDKDYNTEKVDTISKDKSNSLDKHKAETKEKSQKIDSEYKIPSENHKKDGMHSFKEIKDTKTEVLDLEKQQPDSKKEVRKPLIDKISPQIMDSAEELKKSEDIYHCSKKDYDKFKENLIKFHCEKFGEPDCNAEVIDDRSYLAKLMFRFYDTDLNGLLVRSELEEASRNAELSECSVVDMLTYEHLASPGVINLGEFYTIFSLKKAQLFDKNQVMDVLATVGHGLELTCGIHGGGGDIIWQRHGVDIRALHMADITSFNDGSLYISKVTVHHSGNFTCFDRSDPGLVQTHSIQIQMVPTVRVEPLTQQYAVHSDVVVKCHVEGIPRPHISWQMNEEPLPPEQHYFTLHHNESLLIHDADNKKDTGAYTCVGENEAGVSQHIATVFIENNTAQSEKSQILYNGHFAVFHNDGYTIYDPLTCTTHHMVTPDFDNFKYSSHDNPKLVLCTGKKCSWGKAAAVRGKFIYISQPDLNRVIVMQAEGGWNPVQVIETDKVPMLVQYMEHLDEVWILCWNGKTDSGSKTVVVVRDASRDKQHRVVHTQPVGNKFDLVENMFLPPSNDLGDTFDHGYVVHSGQRGMYKIDMDDMKYIKSVDLSHYKCVPLNVAFIPLGGKVMVQCEAYSLLDVTYFILELDYLSDQVLRKLSVHGMPLVTPDSRYMIVVDFETGDVSIYTISDQGEVRFQQAVKTSSILSDATFHRANNHLGYDAFLNSHLRDDIYHINLDDGTINTINGEYVWLSDTWVYDSPYHSITGGGVFGDYLLKTSDAGVTIIKASSRNVQCNLNEGDKSHEVVWVGP